MLKKIYHPDKLQCLPEKRNFLVRAGIHGSINTLDPEILNKINQIYLLGCQVIDPVVYHLTATAENFPSELIPESFLGIKSMTVFTSTLGFTLDRVITELAESNRILEAFLLDAWGSEALEALNRHFDEMMRSQNNSGTRRFSPGYGRVDIRMNRFIIEDLLDIKEIEVLESGVMLPRKTTTCLIGWYHEKK